MNILHALLVSEIVDWDYGCNEPTVKTTAEQLREKHPSLKESYDEYCKAKQKYNMLLKLVKVTDKF